MGDTTQPPSPSSLPSLPNEDDDTSYPTSIYSGSVPCAPAEVKEALAQHAPDGKRCLITRQTQALECCHLTKPKKQRALEAAWGMKPGEFNLHALRNIFWLRRDMHHGFDQYMWFLLPTESDLQAAIDFNDRRTGQRASSHYLTVFPGQTSWKYRFLPNNFAAATLRLGDDPMDYTDYTVHTPPYQGLSSILSHIHPFHIIYNVGEKVYKIKNQKPNSDLRYTLPEDPSNCSLLDKCEALYLSWVGSSQSFPQPGSGTAAPQGRNCMGATETTNRYLPTPEQLIHSTDRKRQLETVSSGTRNLTHHWANIDDWVASVKFSALEKDPHSGGTERAKQHLVDYSHEKAREPPQGSWKEWVPEYELVL